MEKNMSVTIEGDVLCDIVSGFRRESGFTAISTESTQRLEERQVCRSC